MKKTIVIAAIFVFLLNACTSASTPYFNETTNQTIAALKTRDFDTLQTLIHPEKGVRLSPYATVDTKKDIVLKPFELDNFESKLWGNYDGSGNPIILTLNEYFDEFVYSADFMNASEIKKNEIIGSGNSLNNLQKVYGNADFIEYHFSGFDPEVFGMDWKSLRLVFEEYEGRLKLIGIIHDQWTI